MVSAKSKRERNKKRFASLETNLSGRRLKQPSDISQGARYLSLRSAVPSTVFAGFSTLSDTNIQQ